MTSAQAWAEFLALCAVPDDEFEANEERAAELVGISNERGEPEVVAWAMPLLADPAPWRRQGAAWVLGQHGYREGRPFGDQVLPALVQAARVEQDDLTREVLVAAIGHAEHRSASVLSDYRHIEVCERISLTTRVVHAPNLICPVVSPGVMGAISCGRLVTGGHNCTHDRSRAQR
jgi:hypothetical protein